MSYGKVAAIIPAAGQGVRMGGKKQFLKLDGIPIFVHTLRKFIACSDVTEIILAAPQEDIPAIEEILSTEQLNKKVIVVAGGSRRQDSVENCLGGVSTDTALVAVHDAVRPFVSVELISAVIAEAARTGASILGILSVDTVKQVQQTRIVGTIPRERIVLAQTPQVFRFDILKQAFAKAKEENFTGTDEASLVEHIGHEVTVVAGSERNIKITTPADLELAHFYHKQELAAPVLLRNWTAARPAGDQIMSEPTQTFRCGIGYDTHRLAAGRKLVLGGVEITSPRGPVAHSDGDVLSHAIVDALLGAAALGDIGRHFPDADPRWKDADSKVFLQEVRRQLAVKGYRILNIDSVVILDEPKLAPHIAAMSGNLAAVLGIEPSQVSIKAKTSEGASPDIAAAHAVALLSRNIA